MRTKVKVISPQVRLARILVALEQELIDASDEDIMEAARDLGMNPKMKGSAAFLGIKFSDKMRMADFFESDSSKNASVKVSRDH
jgi:hypothetical protein